MIKTLRNLILVIIFSLFAIDDIYGFYDYSSQANFKIVNNASSGNPTVEFTGTDLLDVTIPSSVNYNGVTYIVIGIGKQAFMNKSINSDKLKLPETLTYIGEMAFYGCKFMNNKNCTIYLPNNIEKIGNEAFAYCYRGLSYPGKLHIDLPKSLKEISYQTFSHSDLSSVTISDGVEQISEYAFGSFKGSVYGGKNIKIIRSSAFYDTKDLYGFDFPEGLEKIEDNAFKLSGLVGIQLPNSLTNIGNYAFSDCVNLKKVIFGYGLTAIADYALQNCTSLTDVTIPENISLIGKSAFSNCSSLSQIDLPSSLSTIGDHAFSNCTSLKSITLPSTITEIEKYTFDKSGLEDINLTNIKVFGDGAFRESNLRQIDLSNALQIGRSAFQDITTLVSVKFGEQIREIGDEAFSGDTWFPIRLTAISLEKVGNQAFKDCNISELLITPTLKYFGYSKSFTSKESTNIYVKSCSPIDAFTLMLGKIKDNSNILIPYNCEEQFRKNADWDAVSKYETLPTWTVDHINVTYGQQPQPELSYYYSDRIPFADSLPTPETRGKPIITTEIENIRDAGEYEIQIGWGDTDKENLDPRVMLVNGSLTVEKSKLKATLIPCSIYEQFETPHFKINYDGFMYDDDESSLSKEPNIVWDEPENLIAGEYRIGIEGGESKNYFFEYEGNILTVIKPLTINIDSISITYGDSTPSFKYRHSTEGEKLLGTLHFLIYDENNIPVDNSSKLPVGEYTVSATGMSNTFFVINPGKITVNKRKVVLAAQDYSKTYAKEFPNFKSIIKEGSLAPGDELKDLGDFVVKTDAVYELNVNGLNRHRISPPGKYRLYIEGNSSNNYDVETIEGTYTIMKPDYPGLLIFNPQISYLHENGTTTYGNTVNIHFMKFNTTIWNDETNTFEIEDDYAWWGWDSSSGLDDVGFLNLETGELKKEITNVGLYQIIFPDAYPAFIEITKAPLTVSCKDYERKFGEDNPEFEIIYEGFKNCESEEDLITKPVIYTEANTESPIGEYPIHIEGGESPNYIFIYNPGKLNIVNETFTGLDEVSDTDIKITTGEGMINVEGNLNNHIIEIFNINGNQVYRGYNSSISLEQGFYIVRIGSTVCLIKN